MFVYLWNPPIVDICYTLLYVHIYPHTYNPTNWLSIHTHIHISHKQTINSHKQAHIPQTDHPFTHIHIHILHTDHPFTHTHIPQTNHPFTHTSHKLTIHSHTHPTNLPSIQTHIPQTKLTIHSHSHPTNWPSIHTHTSYQLTIHSHTHIHIPQTGHPFTHTYTYTSLKFSYRLSNFIYLHNMYIYISSSKLSAGAATDQAKTLIILEPSFQTGARKRFSNKQGRAEVWFLAAKLHLTLPPRVLHPTIPPPT